MVLKKKAFCIQSWGHLGCMIFITFNHLGRTALLQNTCFLIRCLGLVFRWSGHKTSLMENHQKRCTGFSIGVACPKSVCVMRQKDDRKRIA